MKAGIFQHNNLNVLFPFIILFFIISFALFNSFIHIEETALNKNKYKWPWTNSILSIVWGRPCVNSIILNTTRAEKIPFDPLDKLILKQYIRYNRYFLIADNNIMICEPQK